MHACKHPILFAAGLLVAGSACQAQEARITVPEGFRIQVFAPEVGQARHMVVRDNGDVYVALSQPQEGGAIAALRDEDGDGKADTVRYFGDYGGGTGIAIHDGWLYASSDDRVMRWRLPQDGLVPRGDPELVVAGFPEQSQHAAKAFTIDGKGNLFVNVGAPSNSCQVRDRTPASPGRQPCPLLERHAGIWRFDAARTDQRQMKDGQRWGTGIRNVVAIDADPETGEVFFLQHGRDQLHELWPEFYSDEDSAELPAEEFHVLAEGTDYGWPYTYWDQRRGERMIAPEYGGDSKTPADPNRYPKPLAAFPGHWAPNDLLFYDGKQFPPEYRNGAFIAFHGSWNRAPLPQEGYKVVFVPFRNGRPSGEGQVFADGFKGAETLEAPDAAAFRPMGLAQGPDGSLYIADSQVGRIWKVTHGGNPVAEQN